MPSASGPLSSASGRCKGQEPENLGVHRGKPRMPSTTVLFELPRVGVIITCHNYRAYVGDAIRSVLAQTYQKWDCVIVDDASTDGSAEHVRQLLETIGDPRLRLLVRPQNGGQIAAFRDGFAAGDQPFVAFLDADDVWLPNFLVAHLSAHLNTMHPASLSSSDAFLVDRDRVALSGTYLGLRKPRSGENPIGVAVPSVNRIGEVAPEIAYSSEYPITYLGPKTPGWIWAPTSSMVFRRGVLEPVLPFPFKVRTGTDYLAATCAHMVAGSLLLSESLGLYRLHGANISTNGAYEGGHVQLLPANKVKQIALGADVLDYVVANAERLDAINGKGFVSEVLAHHLRRFGKLFDDPRIAPFLSPRNRWRWWRKRAVRHLRRLFGQA
ncbi:glycosyl transferase family 2 [Mesorhizobium sp. LNHC221B00]|nr:glycosyl transferase family 2 [Mesorhizobium sp. LNHC232B00]ESY76148.1 glycosyl transferase family 2 [Mesorhizobium sp. LNHC221B00]TPN48249.1 glycosyltransferase family 2 protein [Mesorhizobium sp. B1-1-7]TPN52652.1 glycosyltransferase family 2 protein [Mesorhizobium sp. B1-1-9]